MPSEKYAACRSDRRTTRRRTKLEDLAKARRGKKLVQDRG